MKTRKIIVFVIMLITLLLVTTGCSSNNDIKYKQLTQKEAKELMDSGEEIIILDVRTQQEYDEAHIANAILLPNENIGTEMPSELPDKDAKILVYCRSGNRSAQAAKKLNKMGYTQVYDFGGINTWEYGTVTD